MISETEFIKTLIDKVNDLINNKTPPGTIVPYAGDTIPDDYLICNGSEISRTDYPNLFKAIGTLYGSGDGSSTFKLPDLRDRFIEGSGANSLGAYLSAGLPNITGSHSYRNSLQMLDDYGAFFADPYNDSDSIAVAVSGSPVTKYRMNFNASRCSSVYGNSNTVQPNSLNLNFLIKF